MSRPRPCLDDIYFAGAMIGYTGARLLGDDAFRALVLLHYYSAVDRVWTMTEPRDGGLHGDDERLRRLVAPISARRWAAIRPQLEPFFIIRGGRWFPRNDWIIISSGNRQSLPGAVRAEVLSRHGPICTYCGSTKGHFDIDHILPVIRGGTDDPANLTLACATCNRSKGAKTLAEWRP